MPKKVIIPNANRNESTKSKRGIPIERRQGPAPAIDNPPYERNRKNKDYGKKK